MNNFSYSRQVVSDGEHFFIHPATTNDMFKSKKFLGMTD